MSSYSPIYLSNNLFIYLFTYWFILYLRMIFILCCVMVCWCLLYLERWYSSTFDSLDHFYFNQTTSHHMTLPYSFLPSQIIYSILFCFIVQCVVFMFRIRYLPFVWYWRFVVKFLCKSNIWYFYSLASRSFWRYVMEKFPTILLTSLLHRYFLRWNPKEKKFWKKCSVNIFTSSW